jgi:hypothetical protein
MKYVMFTHEKTGLKLPVLFSDYFNHCDIKSGIGWHPTSAGFFSVIGFKTYGKSDSLKMSPDIDDAEIIKLCLAGMEQMHFLNQDVESNKSRLIAIYK